MKKTRLSVVWAVPLAISLAAGCNGKDDDKTPAADVNGVSASAEVGSLSGADSKKLCEAVVMRAEGALNREVVCTLAGIKHGDGDASDCESAKTKCESEDHESTGRDAKTECAGIGTDVFAGCSATVSEVDACMAAIIGEVASITCENPDGRADAAALQDACKPVLDDPDCAMVAELGHVVAGSGYVHASHVEEPMAGTGGNSGTGGSSMGGGASTGTGGGSVAAPEGKSDCTTCSMLECLLSPARGECDGDTEVCFTQVVDQQAGRAITRGCVDINEAKSLHDANEPSCADIESHVLSSGVTCYMACDGNAHPNCNHPPQLLPDDGTQLFVE